MTSRSKSTAARRAASDNPSSRSTSHEEHTSAPGDERAGDDAGDEEPRLEGSGEHLPVAVERQGGLSRPGSMLSYDAIPVELAEALRGIVNRYELRSGSELPRTIAVTSARSGEGVTVVSQSLATLIAREIGRFVCWVDCSWLTARQIPGSEDRPNLIDLLGDPNRIHTAFQTSPELTQLVSLSPGPVPAASRNLIVRSPEFERLLTVLTDEFDHVIFDLPPVISNANSLALLREADATLLAVKHRSTSLAQVERAIQVMEPAMNLGVVLTHFKSSIPTRLRRLFGE